MKYLDKLMEPCPRCSSTGHVTGMSGDINLCPDCKGDGVVPISIEAGAILELWSMVSKSFDNMTEKFELMNTEQMNEIMQAYADGKDIQISVDGINFFDVSHIKWDWVNYTYRVKPTKTTKPSINWDHVSEVYNYLATDDSGKTYLYETEPIEPYYGIWTHSGNMADASSFMSFKPGDCNWMDSLVWRDGVEEEE